MTPGRRHVLVIASPNEDMGHLDHLDDAARALHELLRDSEVGACLPGLPDGESLLTGEMPAKVIEARIKEAMRYAGDKRATLVLALLGHGFSPENDAKLYYMGCDSRDGVPLESVNVQELLSGAANQPGVRSVIALIDTCTAGAAIPANIAAGTQNGRAGLALLMAARVGQTAYDLGMSRELARLLRSGVPDADATLRLDVVGPLIQKALDAQDLRGFSYPGDLQAEPMWLARNQQAASTLTFGSLGYAELAAALRSLPDSPRVPASMRQLRELHEELSERLRQQRNSPGPGWGARDLSRAVRVTDSLMAAHQTAALLREHLRDALDGVRLRRALVLASRTVDAAGGQPVLSVIDAVEQAALRYPSMREPDSRPQLARLVVALADDAGTDPALAVLKDAWAASLGRVEAYNDALREWAQSPLDRCFRLVVSYDSPDGQWPGRARAWVLYGGRQCGQNEDISCPPDQQGVEAALVSAVDWAVKEAAGLSEELNRIDIAMPSAQLLSWFPEEVEYDNQWLGVNYDVRLRWSARLAFTPKTQAYNNNLRKRLEELPNRPKSKRLYWLGQPEVGDLRALSRELAMGRYAPASGLMHRPEPDLAQDPSLMDLLLRHLPVLLWPQRTSFDPAHRTRVASRWEQLPGDFLVAYRARWAGLEGKKPDLIADIRAVWDDEDWLRFCGAALS